ncbi:unnamed protein product, partial [Didymodactylos carnosus]
LSGFGIPLNNEHLTTNENFEKYITQTKLAIEHIHKQKYLHRDIKPTNIIIINDNLPLNDFDVSCRMDDYEKRKISV